MEWVESEKAWNPETIPQIHPKQIKMSNERMDNSHSNRKVGKLIKFIESSGNERKKTKTFPIQKLS